MLICKHTRMRAYSHMYILAYTVIIVINNGGECTKAIKNKVSCKSPIKVFVQVYFYERFLILLFMLFNRDNQVDTYQGSKPL